MRKILLTPYPGAVVLTRTRREFEREYKRISGNSCTLPLSTTGRMQPFTWDRYASVYLIFAPQVSTLAHELSHAILALFNDIGIDPRQNGGEPFCYLLGHLMDEARKR